MAKANKKPSAKSAKVSKPIEPSIEPSSTKSKGKKQRTVRERTQVGEKGRARRIRTTASMVKIPFAKISQSNKKEYHLPLPDNRTGKILNKRIRFTPKFVREAVQELKGVTWPNARETYRLTMAVFIFSVIFAAIVGLLDFGLDKLFKEVIIKQ